MIIIKTPPTWKCFLWYLNHHSKATIRQKVHSTIKKKKNTKSAQHQTIQPWWTEGTLCNSASACACVVHAWINTCIELYCTSCRCIFFNSSIGLDIYNLTSFFPTTIEEPPPTKVWWLLGSMPKLFSWLKLHDDDINCSISCNINYYIFILWQVKNGKTSGTVT